MTRKSRKKARIRARKERARISYTAAQRTKTTRPEKPGTILVVDGRQLRYDGHIYNMQCVAATTRRTRCRNPVEIHGQVGRWDDQRRYRVDWEADDPYWLEHYGSAQRLFATYRRQRCKTHVDTDAPDAVALEVHDIGPLLPLPSDAFDLIGRYVTEAMFTIMLRRRIDVAELDRPDLSTELTAAARGDMAPLLALVAQRPLPRDLRALRDERRDHPHCMNAPLWLELQRARMKGELTDDQLGQCLSSAVVPDPATTVTINPDILAVHRSDDPNAPIVVLLREPETAISTADMHAAVQAAYPGDPITDAGFQVIPQGVDLAADPEEAETIRTGLRYLDAIHAPTPAE
ncbi:hypothetical protein ACFWPH_28545 [Nocardia sp. NPDC058499]|uniref:hypothetical protein n=1 Tax=Nocardia sp. NPDC058499 TaxID=3346530 RepID=UPI00364DC109